MEKLSLKLKLKRNLNPTLENNDYRTILLNHNIPY